jgi:Ca2+-binding RTX toxin-like protein
MVVRIGTDRSETLRGTQGADYIDGRGGNDTILGLGGDDQLFGSLGANRLDGGAGRDAAGFAFSEDDGATGFLPVNADLNRGTYTVGGAVTRLAGIEDLFGSEADDRLVGDAGANSLQGLDGDDLIFGNGGNDRLVGYAGADEVFGGAGADSIDTVIGSGSFDPDEVHGGSGNDTFRLGLNPDQAWGDAGADVFEVGVTTFSDEPLEPLFTVRDFSARSGDVIDLPEFDPDGSGDPQPYTFVGTGALARNGVAEVRFEQRGGATFVQYEVADDDEFGQEVNEIALTGRLTLTADDFILG